MAAYVSIGLFVSFLYLTSFALLSNAQGHHGHSHDHHGHSHDHHGHAHDHHDHVHDHHDEVEQPAHFKYSKEANEDIKPAQHVHRHDDQDHGHSHEAPLKDKRPSPSSDSPLPKPSSHPAKDRLIATGLWLWVQALGSTAIVSAAPVFILLLIPLDNRNEHQPMLKVLLSFASGGLLGDAFLHLIPHALTPHSHDGSDHEHGHSHEESHGHDHSHDIGVGLWVLAGIVAFLIVEKFVRHIKGSGHSHSHSHSDKEEPKHFTEKTPKEGTPGTEIHSRAKTSDAATADKDKDKDKDKETKSKEKHAKSSEQGSDIKVAGYLNLAADFAHNFTDGLAIGASYLAGRNVGIVTTVTILLHEVPHEVGDFAILLQSGCSKRKAMLLQFTTAIGAMVGTLCSLLAEGLSDAAVSWILPFTAGGFIYIATVSVIPELLSDCRPWQSFKETLAMLVGIGMLVLIAKYE